MDSLYGVPDFLSNRLNCVPSPPPTPPPSTWVLSGKPRLLGGEDGRGKGEDAGRGRSARRGDAERWEVGKGETGKDRGKGEEMGESGKAILIFVKVWNPMPLPSASGT